MRKDQALGSKHWKTQRTRLWLARDRCRRAVLLALRERTPSSDTAARIQKHVTPQTLRHSYATQMRVDLPDERLELADISDDGGLKSLPEAFAQHGTHAPIPDFC